MKLLRIRHFKGDRKERGEDVVMFKEDLIPSHTPARWEEMGWGGVVGSPQELLPTLPPNSSTFSSLFVNTSVTSYEGGEK